MAIEKGIPSQLDEEDLAAEVELEVPGAMEPMSSIGFEGEARYLSVRLYV